MMRRLSQRPTVASIVPSSFLLKARLRTRFSAADGVPAPVIRPVAPRTTSTRSYRARLPSTSPALQAASQVVGILSICRLVTSKPRAVKLARWVSYWLTETPVTLLATSVMVSRPWSSMRCWVMTDTDCGVSRSDMSSGVAVRVRPMVYEPTASPSFWACTCTCGIDVVPASVDWAWATNGSARLTHSVSVFT